MSLIAVGNSRLQHRRMMTIRHVATLCVLFGVLSLGVYATSLNAEADSGLDAAVETRDAIASAIAAGSVSMRAVMERRRHRRGNLHSQMRFNTEQVITFVPSWR